MGRWTSRGCPRCGRDAVRIPVWVTGKWRTIFVCAWCGCRFLEDLGLLEEVRGKGKKP